MENSEQNQQDEKQDILNAIDILKLRIREYKKITGKRAIFILEKSAPRLNSSALKNCRVFPSRESLLETVPKQTIVAEIGTQHGNWANHILNVVQPKELHLFDLSFKLLREDVRQNRFIKLHQGQSSNKLAAFSDEYFDLIYIDGDHSYHGVTRDINQAVKKLKRNGIMIFNDYTVWSPLEVIPYGVVTAVNELINSGGWEMIAIALTPSGYWDVALKRQA